MKERARYVKIVEWSDEDGCHVGSCPGLLFGGCHGTDERSVFEELCVIGMRRSPSVTPTESRFPPPTAGSDLANKLQDVA